MFGAILVGLVVALGLGTLNALIIIHLRIPDFIATLAMLGFVRGCFTSGPKASPSSITAATTSASSAASSA